MITWICIIACIRIASMGIGTSRLGQLALLHTYGNKFSGVLITFAPFVMPFFELSNIMLVLCTVATLASLEDLYINCRSKTLNRNVHTFLDLRHEGNSQ
jgi:CDP-diacylglycerol--glycerol-3-phosphate 3-phosphatidyltransferase